VSRRRFFAESPMPTLKHSDFQNGGCERPFFCVIFWRAGVAGCAVFGKG